MNRGIFLILVLILGLAIRCYNLNFPSLGYHNTKENEYLSMAQLMSKTGDYTSKKVYFLNALEEDPTIRDNLQAPLIAYQILLAWNIFGENLWAPRLFNILFSVLSIVVLYFICSLLFNNKILSLLGASFLAVIPLGAFFSRNTGQSPCAAQAAGCCRRDTAGRHPHCRPSRLRRGTAGTRRRNAYAALSALAACPRAADATDA